MDDQQKQKDQGQGQETTLVPCPQCGCRQVTLVGEDFDHEGTPEGLVGVTRAQCQRMDCLHEFVVVTHRQVLSSIRSWTNANHLIR